MIIAFSGRKVHGHKIMLAKRSTYFAAMFRNDFKVCVPRRSSFSD